MGWLLDHVPVWVWIAIPLAAAVFTIPYWMPIWLALPRWVKTAILAIGAAFTLFAAGRRSGKKDSDEARLKADAHAIENRNKVNEEVGNLKPAARDRRLDKWMRD